MTMDDITIEPVRDGDLAEILRTFERFWGDREFPGKPGVRRVSPPDGFTDMTMVQDYAGSGRTRIVMRRSVST